MPLIVQCPNPLCGKSCSVADSLSGGPVRCPNCDKPFMVKPTIDGQKSDTNKNQPSSNANPFPILPAEFGRYRILQLLGKGGMGAVYLAEDSQLRRQVALKIPFFDALESPQRAERFVREARSAAALHHPNICTVFDAGQLDGRPFLTMAYLAGKPLEDEIDPDVPMPQLRAAEIARKVALALEHAHRKGVVHRDLKPANVMLAADDGEPVVMDFGLAKRFGEVEAGETKLTHAGTLLGTPSYMSPEQVRGNSQAIGPATDVYSLGVVLFEMLTGDTPYSGAFRVIVGQIIAAPVPPVKEFRADVDARLDAICKKAMAKEPSARFASMAEFANALGQYLKAPKSSPPPLSAPLAILVPQAPSPVVDRSPFGDLVETTAPTPAAKKAKSRRAVAIALALALLVPLGCWLAIAVLRVETPNGTLIVEMNDDEVEARIKNGKLILSGPDGKVRYTLSANDRSKKLDAGPYKIRVEGADGLVLDTPEFTIKKGQQVTVRVKLEQNAVAKKDTPDLNPARKAADRPASSKRFKVGRALNGKWIIVDDRLEQTSFDANVRLDFGDPAWKDYDFAVDVMQGQGNEQVCQLFRVGEQGAFFYGLGHARNSVFSIESQIRGKGARLPLPHLKGHIDQGKWYRMLVRVRGTHAQCFLNDTKLFDFESDEFPSGCVGLRTYWTQYRFRNIKVSAPDGTVLLEGLPDLNNELPDKKGAAPVAVDKGFVSLFNGKDLTGWQTLGPKEPNAWSIQEGILVGRSNNWASLRTERDDFSDFHLRVEAMVDGAGGSVRFRYPLTGKPGTFVAQIATTAGRYQTGTLLRKTLPTLHCSWWVLAEVSSSAALANTWITLEAIAVGDHITLKVNGKTTADVRQADGQRSGFIAVYPEQGSGIRFRTIEIKELTAGK